MIFIKGHALPQILTSESKIFKLIWTICLLASLGMCLYMVVRCVNQYLQYGCVTTQVYIFEEEVPLPLITICNSNPMVTREAYAFLQNYYNTEYNVDITTFQDLAYMVQNKTVNYDTDWLIYQTYDPNYNVTLKKSFGYSLQKFLTFCQVNNKPCNQSDFVWYYNPIYGKIFF